MRSRHGPLRLGCFLAFVGWLLAWPTLAQDHVRPVETRVHPIERFHPFLDETRFGKLEFLGGLHVASSDPLWGGLSGLSVIGERMVAVSDAGYWFEAQLQRRNERLVGLSSMRLTPMLDDEGKPFRYKYQIDAEGLAHVAAVSRKGWPPVVVDSLLWLVTTERDIRMLDFDGDPFDSRPARSSVLFRPPAGLRGNRALESVAILPVDGLTTIVTISEDSLDDVGHIRGFLIRRRNTFEAEAHEIAVRKREAFAPTDAAFLPSGDLLLLERRFSLSAGPGMRIRRVAGDTIRPGAVLDGDVLIEVGLPHQIDNMEGLAVSPHPEGHRLTLVSDDNRSLLQRTLVLEFLLRE